MVNTQIHNSWKSQNTKLKKYRRKQANKIKEGFLKIINYRLKQKNKHPIKRNGEKDRKGKIFKVILKKKS